MKAIALQPDRSRPALRMLDMPMPVRSSADEALVQVLAVGLDGTDKELIRHRESLGCVERGNLVLGHELLGRVVEAGPDCRLKPGDLVTALVRRPCPEDGCVPCRSGRSDYCTTGRFTERGISGADGFLAEYIVEREMFLVLVPAAFGELGVFIEPQSVIEKALTAVRHIQGRLPGWQPRSALVLGAGPLGALTALTCRTLGYDVTVYSKEAPERVGPSVLRQAGCVYRSGEGGGGGSASSGAPPVASPGAPGETWDLIVECTGYSPLAFGSIGSLARNGVLVILGVAAETGPVPAPTDAWMRRLMTYNQSVVGSANASRDDFETAIARLQTIRSRYPSALERLITDRVDLADVPALDLERVDLKAIVRVAT